MAVNRLYAETNNTLPRLDVIGLNKAGGAVKSGDPVLCGQIPGVALEDAASDGTTVIQKDGIFTVPVKGETSGGNNALAPGAILYFDSAKAALNGDNTKVRWGYLLKGVGSGSTDAAAPAQVGY